MNPIDDAHQAALSAIDTLKAAAENKDPHAALKLYEIAFSATFLLNRLVVADNKEIPAIHADILNRIAASSMFWPVNVPAVHELRVSIDATLPPAFGKAGSLKLAKETNNGRPRDFHPDSRTGFAFKVAWYMQRDGKMPQCDADLLCAAVAYLEGICGGDWDSYPWPESLLSEAKRESHRSEPTKHVVKKWLRAGFKSLF